MCVFAWQHAEDNSCRRRSSRDSPEDRGVLLHGTMSWGPIHLHTLTSHQTSFLKKVTWSSATTSPIRTTVPRLYQISFVTPCLVYSARTFLPLSAKPSDSVLALRVNLDSFQTGIVKRNKPPAITILLQLYTSHKGFCFPSPHPFETEQPAGIHTS